MESHRCGRGSERSRWPRGQRTRWALALLGWLVAGCTQDPLRDPIIQYWRNVARPATNEREAALKEMQGLFREAARGGPGADKLHEKLREEVVGRLERAEKLFRDYKPAAPILDQLNKLFLDDGTVAVKQVEEFAKAIERRNEEEVKASVEKLAELNRTMAELLSDLETLALLHSVELKM